MHRQMRSLVLAFSLLGLSSIANAGDGDTLLIERVQQLPANAPTRGMTAAQVEAKYGVPGQRLDDRGGQKRAWPVIARWVYPDFTVYFEKGRVIDAVANKASADEIGPKPATR